MAIKSLNSVGGFSVKDGLGDIVIIIDSSGNVNTPDLTVTGLSNLGNVANITITGGSSGYVLTTDGAGSLSWSAAGGGGGNTWIVSQMPYYINSGETYYCIANTQGLFSIPITIDGNLEIDGILVEV